MADFASHARFLKSKRQQYLYRVALEPKLIRSCSRWRWFGSERLTWPAQARQSVCLSVCLVASLLLGGPAVGGNK